MIRFVHTADVHFGMENYGKLDTKTGIHSRLLDFARAFDHCIDFSLEHDIDFFLFAGDAYKTANPSPTQQKLLMQSFMRLYKANIPVVMVIGNHDNPLSFGKAHSLDIFGALPVDGFHVIAKPESFVLKTKNGPIQIVGIPWPTRNTLSLKGGYANHSGHEISTYIAKTVGTIIADFAQKLDPKIPAVLTGHLTISNGIFSGSEKRAIYGTDPILLPSQLAIEPFDYVGLGHLHRYQDLNKDGYPAVVYSGSIERIDFGERKEDKGFCVIEIPEKNKASHRFVKVPIRPFVQLEIKLKADISQTEQIVDALSKKNIKDAIVKILYHVPSGQRDSVDLNAIQRACSEAMHLVAVIPIRKPITREHRTTLNVNMDLPTLLEEYFASKPTFAKKKNTLVKKALVLIEEHQNTLLDPEYTRKNKKNNNLDNISST